jgi:hypothetical protein
MTQRVSPQGYIVAARFAALKRRSLREGGII